MTSLTVAAAIGVAGFLPMTTASAAPPPRSAPAGASASTADTVDDGSVSDEDQALQQAQSTGQPAEVVSARTELSDEWANPDGSFSVKRYGTPVRIWRGGAWVPTDPTLQFAADGTVVPKAASVVVAFSGGGTGPLLSGVKDGRTLTLTWPTALPTPTLNGNVATYADILPGVDLQLKAEVEGFSQLIVVKTAQAAQNPALAQLTYTMSTVGLSVDTDPGTGSVTATDPAGQTIFTSPTPLMWDSTTQTSTSTPAAKTQVEPADAAADDQFDPPPGAQDAQMTTAVSGDTLTITPDQSLLTGTTTTYPVYIDPSWAWGKRQNWTRVYRKYPNTSYWNANEVARVGYENETYGLSRSFFQMDISNLRGAGVISSTFRIKNTWSWSCQDRPVQLWQTGPISKSTTWNHQPGKIGTSPLATVNDAKGWSNSSCPAGNLEFNVTNTVKKLAAAGKATSITLGMYAADETDTYGWKKFDPKTAILETTYNHPPKTPYNLKTQPSTSCTGGGLIGNASIKLFATVDDLDAGNLTADFQLFAAGSSTPVADQTITAAKGHVATLDLPNATTPTGSYTWKVRAKDPLGALSTWSTTCTFSVDRTRPGNPPLISSPEFPPGNNGWPTNTGAARDSGNFTFSPNGASDVVKYYWWTDTESDRKDMPVSPGGSITVSITPTSAGPHEVFVYDVDQANNSSDTAVYLYYAKGTGISDAPGDLNGDGFNDIWSIDANGALLTYAGRKGGYFSAASNGGQSFSGAQTTYRGDWGNDGHNDLVSLEASTTGGKKLWEYPNTGNGTVTTEINVERGKSALTVECPIVIPPDPDNPDNPDGCPVADDHWHDADQIVAPGDINGDGSPDLLVKEGQLLWAYYGDRNTKQLDTHGQPVLVGGNDWDQYTVIAPGDLNGDGFADLLLRENATGDIYRAYGQQGEQAGVVDPTTWGSTSQRVEVATGFPATTYPVIASDGDLNGDGVPDLWAHRSDNVVLGWPGSASGTGGYSVGAPFTISATVPVGGGQAPTPGKPDMSGDTLADMVVQTPDGTVSVRRKESPGPYFDTGTQATWGWQNYLGQPGQGRLYFADIDGDGAKDLISLETDGDVIVRLNNNVGTAFDTGTLMSAHWSNFLGQPGQGKLYFADITGDHKADLIVLDTNGDITVRKNMGSYFDSGTLMSSNWSNFLGNQGQGRLYFADITGDGKADLIVLDTYGDISVRTNMGTYFDAGALMSSNWSNFLGQPGQGKLYFADITGDGKSDLVVLDTAGTVAYRINMGTYFDAGRDSSAHWSNFLGGAGQGLLYFE